MSDFKIAAAQVPSLCGDIDANIATHVAALSAAAKHSVSVLVFPELSLTGYEPELASQLAITADDERLTPLAAIAQEHQITVVVGAPLQQSGSKPHIGAILFTTDGSRHAYSKMHLGGTEPNYFAPGTSPLSVSIHGQSIGLAICADTSKPSHPQTYSEGGSTIYAAGVFLNAEWYATDAPRLAGYASRFRMLVLMANHGASVGTYTSVGKSAVWAPGGELLAESAGVESSLVIATRARETWCGAVARI